MKSAESWCGMLKLIERYLASFDEIHTGTIRYTEAVMADKELTLREKKEQICDFLLDYLIDAYLLGLHTCEDLLGFTTTPDLGNMRKAIELRIEGKTFRDRVADHLIEARVDRMAMLAESEYHRVFNAAEMDAAKTYEKTTGKTVFKEWRTVGDDRVRDTHDYIEGVKIPLAELFHTFDGDTALQPGGFGDVENNAGCRCWLHLSTEKS